MVPDDLQAALSDIANAAQVVNPATSRCRRTLETLLADAITVEEQVNRILVALSG